LDQVNACDWAIKLNQASTATSVTDDTGGGGDQTAISGTSVDADDPPGFDYSLSPPVELDGTVTMGATQALTLTGVVTYATTVSMGVTQALTLTGVVTYATTVSMGATQALTLAGALSYSMPFPLTVSLTLDGTVEGGTVETPSGWETIYGAIGEARGQHLKHLERRRHPVDCPIHLWPLEVVGNVYHCKFGGHVVRLPAPSP
jgi:hypothetical protein